MSIIAIDFEASCLPSRGRSYPIEVGIADAAGFSRAWLIRPRPEWHSWAWTDEAEALHGISREQLEREGVPPQVVVGELTEAVAGRRLVADSDLDRRWLETLMGDIATPALHIDHVGQLLDEIGSTSTEIEAARARLSTGSYRWHRAAEDARWLAALIATLQDLSIERSLTPLFSWRPATPVADELPSAMVCETP